MPPIAIDPRLPGVVRSFCASRRISSANLSSLSIFAGVYDVYEGPPVGFFERRAQPGHVLRLLSIPITNTEDAETAWQGELVNGEPSHAFPEESFLTETLLLATGEEGSPTINEVRLVSGELYVMARVPAGGPTEDGQHPMADIVSHLRQVGGRWETECVYASRLPARPEPFYHVCFFAAASGATVAPPVPAGHHELVPLSNEGRSDGVYVDPASVPYDATASAPASVVDETLRVPPFPDELRRAVLPRLDAEDYSGAEGYVRSDLADLLDVSELDEATRVLLEALAPYVDLEALDAAVPGLEGLTRVVEAVHQFQKKVFADTGQHDGWPGPTVLSSLGFAPLYSLDEAREKLSSSDSFSKAEKIEAIAGVDFDRPCIRRLEAELRRGKQGFKEIRGAEWFRYIATPGVFGQSFKSPVHAVLVRQLRVAEAQVYGQYWAEDPTLSPAVIGKERLGVDGEHSGERGGIQMHGLGLALDLDLRENPWVGTESPERWDRRLRDGGFYNSAKTDLDTISDAARRREALELYGRDNVESMAKRVLDLEPSIRLDDDDDDRYTELTASIFGDHEYSISEDQWRRIRSHLFSRSRVIANHRFERMTTAVKAELLSELRGGESVVVSTLAEQGIEIDVDELIEDLEAYDEDVGRFFRLLGTERSTQRAFRTLRALSEAIRRKAGEPGLPSELELEDTRHYNGFRAPSEIGFMNHHERLVLAMRDTAALAWGGIDFGANANGDMMHFDVRLFPYLQLIRAADIDGRNNEHVNEGHPRWPDLRCSPEDDAEPDGADASPSGD